MTQTDHAVARLREALRALREADEGTAPAFDAVLARRLRAARVSARWPVLAVAATLLLAAGAGYVLARPRPLEVPREVIALSAWTSPTAVLLQGARRHLPANAPHVGASLLDTLNGDFR